MSEPALSTYAVLENKEYFLWPKCTLYHMKFNLIQSPTDKTFNIE